jgi:hypothetical protein
MGLILPIRAGFTSVYGGWGEGLCLVFLVPDMDILPRTKVA